MYFNPEVKNIFIKAQADRTETYIKEWFMIYVWYRYQKKFLNKIYKKNKVKKRICYK